MDFRAQIEELKKSLDQEPLDQVENSLRELITELYIKRDQVGQLRNDVASVKAENMELKRNLDSASKSHGEQQFNLTILSRKVHCTEQELAEKKNTLLQINMQHKMMVVEVDTLKELLQESDAEKTELSKKVELYEAKQKCYNAYNNEFSKRENHLRSYIDDINEILKIVQAEQLRIVELFKSVDLAKEALHELEKMKKDNERITVEKEKLEEQYIKAKSKLVTLEELIMNDGTLESQNMTDIIFNQWKLNRKHYREHMDEKNKIITNLTLCYSKQKSVNTKLVLRNEELSKINSRVIKELEQLKESYVLAEEKTNANIQEPEEMVKEDNKSGLINEDPNQMSD